jgi:hypothetical protein
MQMGKFAPRRPSASMIVALLALVLALGSTASAGVPERIARLISGSRIKQHSIQGNRLENNTLTGRQIKESSLGEVPHAKVAKTATSAATATNAANAVNATSATHATSADTATNAANAVSATNAAHATSAETATNASELGGVGPSGFLSSSKLVRYSATMDIGDPEKTIATLGPLTFTASCIDDAGNTHATLSATSNADGISLIRTALDSGDSAVVQEVNSNTPTDDFLPIIRAVDSAQSVAIEGVPIIAVNTLGKDCRFFGTLVEDAG